MAEDNAPDTVAKKSPAAETSTHCVTIDELTGLVNTLVGRIEPAMHDKLDHLLRALTDVPADADLEEKLQIEEIQEQFRPESVSLVGEKIEVTIKRLSSKTPCYVMLGFDTDVPELKPKDPTQLVTEKVTFEGEISKVQFQPPDEWLADKGPRWVLVLISLTEYSFGRLDHAYNPRLRATDPSQETNPPSIEPISFSVHPFVVAAPGYEIDEA